MELNAALVAPGGQANTRPGPIIAVFPAAFEQFRRRPSLMMDGAGVGHGVQMTYLPATGVARLEIPAANGKKRPKLKTLKRPCVRTCRLQLPP
jgi:hypothetical protein